MLEKLAALEARYDELSELLGSPEVVSKPELLMKYGQEQANLEPIVTTFRRYQEVVTQLEEARDMLVEESDEDMRAMVREEVTRLKSEREEITVSAPCPMSAAPDSTLTAPSRPSW